tara:strand:+ start:365 stop:850 length:486 start_codon:yes stop_codon:yes gene_type:complete
MGSSISKYLEENVGHFGNNAKQFSIDTKSKIEKVMSDREIMNAKSGVSEKLTIKVFEKEYPELSKEFNQIQKEMYAMFAAKHMDYGLNNIALGGDIVNNSDDKQFSLTGLCIRLTDKISRLKNLLVNGKNFVKGEGMEDTFIDIANYGIIGLLVGRDKWKK